MREIKLTRGKYTTVDDSDYEYLSQWKWSYSTNGYAIRSEWPSRKMIYMHRFVMQTPESKVTDHKNEDRLDNRRQNLRICTKQQNALNVSRVRSTSGYKGVTWSKQHSKWKAQLGVTKGGVRKNVYLGQFRDIKQAVNAYLQGVKDYHGENTLLGGGKQ